MRSSYRGAVILSLVGIAVGGSVLSCVSFMAQPFPAQGDNGEVLPFDHSVTIARHAAQSLSEMQVDNTFAIAGGLLYSVEDECPDVYCPATLTRVGDITTFNTGDNIVTNDAQLNAIFTVDGDFKVVSFMVGVCGASSGDSSAVVIGCASTGGSVVIAYDAPPDVWAHEWGHVQGLSHRNDCARNIMHAYELETNAVNETERNAFLTPTPGSTFRQISAEPLFTEEALMGPVSGETAQECVTRCVARRYLSGIPADALTDMDTTARVDALLDVLATAPPAQACANIFRLLGIAGEARACTAIMDHLASFDGELTTDEFAAYAEGLLALGRLAMADDTGEALGFLTAGALGNDASTATLKLRTDTGATSPAGAALSRIAVMALGMSQHPDAIAFLEAMQADAATSKARDPWMASQVEEALARANGSFTRTRATQGLEIQP